MRTDTPPHATHRTSLFEAAFAQASATIALVQVRNGLKALGGAVSPVSSQLAAEHIEANLQIIERALGLSAGGKGGAA